MVASVGTVRMNHEWSPDVSGSRVARSQLAVRKQEESSARTEGKETPLHETMCVRARVSARSF